MTEPQKHEFSACQARCCPCTGHGAGEPSGVTRRGFLGGAALAGLALGGLSWSAIAAAESDDEPAPRSRCRRA